jgi:Flp pilus assembly protein TadD
MKIQFAHVVLAGLAGAASVLLVCNAGGPNTVSAGQSATASTTPIKIDYPLDGSVFPPEITPPTFLWHDQNGAAERWTIEIQFENAAAESLRVEAGGDLMQPGEADPNAGPPPQLTPEQASTRTWKPDEQLWARIKQLSVKGPARITIKGISANGPVSAGTVKISTSADPVGAPVFYRDVPLMLPAPSENGPIAPLPKTAMPYIKWRIRSIAEPTSHTVMTGLPTCANCHSFSRDGKTLGLDLDGPRNDKGLYARSPVARQMALKNSDVIRWSSFGLNDEARPGDTVVKRFGFMSQISPDGRYVITSIGPPNNAFRNDEQDHGLAPGILDRLYSINFKNINFIQVFYPTRGILAWYDSKDKTMHPLPGADDPRFVQTSAFWSPDGKYLIYSRATAREPFPAGVPKAEYANDPNETQIQYDLYKIPFNDGRGGKAEPIEGASGNGMSNNFPKVSPDGKWIVFVENKNGLLMRPDSKLYMVPFNGGKARLMNCNLSLMNSWHTFSPNGRWLAFSSKARGPYTRLMLTHIDKDGNDSPAIIVDGTTASNRAVNIPEFVNMPPDQAIDKIDPEAVEYYRLFDQAFKMIAANDIPDAVETLQKAVKADPNDEMGHFLLGTTLSDSNRESEALPEFRKAVEISPRRPKLVNQYAMSLYLTGDKAAAAEQMQKAVELDPTSVEYRFNLGFILESQGKTADAAASLEKAVELSRSEDWKCLAELGKVYDKLGRLSDAARATGAAADLAEKQNQPRAARELRDKLSRYESETDQKKN